MIAAKAYDRSTNCYICQIPIGDAQASCAAVDGIPIPVRGYLRCLSCRTSSFAPAFDTKENEGGWLQSKDMYETVGVVVGTLNVVDAITLNRGVGQATATT